MYARMFHVKARNVNVKKTIDVEARGFAPILERGEKIMNMLVFAIRLSGTRQTTNATRPSQVRAQLSPL